MYRVCRAELEAVVGADQVVEVVLLQDGVVSELTVGAARALEAVDDVTAVLLAHVQQVEHLHLQHTQGTGL